jgi:cytochrome P450
VHTTDAGYFELRSGETWRDPFPTYAVLRKHDPVHHVSRGDFWVLTRFDDVWAAAGDPATFSSAQGLTVSYDEIDATGLGDAMPMVFLDPPAHTDFRRLVTRNLTPRKVSMIEPAVRAFVVQRIESAKGQGGVDIVEQLFKPLPSFVVAHYLGVPPDDQALFDRWTEAIVQAAAGDEAAANPSAFAELLAYFTELAERRRTEPGDDIVSDLVRAGIETVSLARILGFAFTMVAGGNDTATGGWPVPRACSPSIPRSGRTSSPIRRRFPHRGTCARPVWRARVEFSSIPGLTGRTLQGGLCRVGQKANESHGAWSHPTIRRGIRRTPRRTSRFR